MTANDLYMITPVEVEQGINPLIGFYYNHIPEVTGLLSKSSDDLKGIGDKIEVRTIKIHWFDHRRFWRIATVWHEDKAVMVIQNAGREGDDFSRRYITDRQNFDRMIKYLGGEKSSKYIVSDDSIVISPSSNIRALTEFYGEDLETIGKFTANGYPITSC